MQPCPGGGWECLYLRRNRSFMSLPQRLTCCHPRIPSYRAHAVISPPMCLLGNLVPGAQSGPASVAFRVGGGCGAWPALASPPILGKAAGGALRDGCESAQRNVEDALFPAHQRTNVLGPGRGGPDITVWLHRSHVRAVQGRQPGARACGPCRPSPPGRLFVLNP